MFNMWAEGKIGNTGEVTKALMAEKRAGHLFDDAHRVQVPTLLLATVMVHCLQVSGLRKK